MGRTHLGNKNTIVGNVATPFFYRNLQLIIMFTSLTAVICAESVHGPTICFFKTHFNVFTSLFVYPVSPSLQALRQKVSIQLDLLFMLTVLIESTDMKMNEREYKPSCNLIGSYEPK